MTIKDVAHAVRILKALVEQGKRMRDPAMGANMDTTWSLIALIEGAKAVLGEYERLQQIDRSQCPDARLTDWGKAKMEGVGKSIILLAQAYAPKMAKAGMEIPKAEGHNP